MSYSIPQKGGFIIRVKLLYDTSQSYYKFVHTCPPTNYNKYASLPHNYKCTIFPFNSVTYITLYTHYILGV